MKQTKEQILASMRVVERSQHLMRIVKESEEQIKKLKRQIINLQAIKRQAEDYACNYKLLREEDPAFEWTIY